MSINVAELFAGVGGFRLGLEKSGFNIVWSNQWEPLTKTQHASIVYQERFGKQNHSNVDINVVPVSKIPDHDLLCGGFPCQDYSVATTLNNSKGLKGKKGVLWWSIYRILEKKGKRKPKYLFLENVDRLLKSPADQRGRDFAVMLQSLNELGYAVEWRVINAADYGMPQRRRRVFFIGYHKSTKIYKDIMKSGIHDWLIDNGTIASVFPVNAISKSDEFDIKGDLVEITKNFNKNKRSSPFLNTGIMIKGKVSTIKTEPIYEGDKIHLKDIIRKDTDIDESFFIDENDTEKWEYLKGAKKEKRTTKGGFTYNYSEGGMIYPDKLNKPSRTIITGEGGRSPSRFKHVIETERGLRRLTPIELERLNMFPDDHTKLDGITDAKRAFFMGNALVVGIIEKLGDSMMDKLKQ
tara:strand:- start:1413 stop:2636 length:1224 start_codon:yes stop_codon:yes gene_type:complete